ncbi:MAG: guanylate kinase, partial [Bacilli bacterium]|nr:guanylate kinase [Bacilli bacterium]
MIILVGASASGKTEIAKILTRKYGIVKAITHTTRDMREGEKNGVDYFFVSKDEFAALAKQNAFVETTFYNG